VRADEADGSVSQSPDEIRTFLAAISTVLRETVSAFESTVGRITEITVMRPGRADRELVVALQDFDRLHQEFSTLGEVLARLSNKSQEGIADHLGEELMAGISIADLKERLAHQLMILTTDLPDAEPSEDVVF
jgi:hypothetical protein